MTLTSDGRPGPIEERIGRRLVRLVDPVSDEGIDLLLSRSVLFIGPGGNRLGYVHPEEAIAALRKELEDRIDALASSRPQDTWTWEKCLDSLEDWGRRIGEA